jgi:DNA-binding transcriptional regulator YiaG
VTAIGEFIRRERRARLMTQRELAWNLATSVVNVRAWENGYRVPGPESSSKILGWIARAPRVRQQGRAA